MIKGLKPFARHMDLCGSIHISGFLTACIMANRCSRKSSPMSRWQFHSQASGLLGSRQTFVISFVSKNQQIWIILHHRSSFVICRRLCLGKSNALGRNGLCKRLDPHYRDFRCRRKQCSIVRVQFVFGSTKVRFVNCFSCILISNAK